ncbi:MAG: FAD-dependent oxidoreductase, partial [Angelakisella sp.]
IKGEPVAIGRLERFVADWHMAQPQQEITAPLPNGKKVAVVGAGPAGLTCAGDLAKQGYSVTVFEALHTAGGVLVYGIPEFRLPKAIVAGEIAHLQKLGVTIETDAVVGRIVSVDELFEQGYKAVFIGSGAGLPAFMGIPGESLAGVCSANEYLTRINLMKAYLPEYDTPVRRGKAVTVVGGGNVAMDAARCAKRMGAEVTVLYRRSLEEMPARREEIHHAEEEGISFRVLAAPKEIVGDENGEVKAVRCIEMELGEPDASGRRRPMEKAGSEFTLEADTVIMAIGTSPNPLLHSTTEGLLTNKYGCIIADEAMKTSRDAVFAGGDAVTGAATVILAMGAGKTAAQSIDRLLREEI